MFDSVGDLWYIDGENNIGHVLTSGKVIQYSLPGRLSEVGANVGYIASGSDGAMWFTEPGYNAVGRLKHGKFTIYTLPPAQYLSNYPKGSEPNRITVDRGAMWFY